MAKNEPLERFGLTSLLLGANVCFAVRDALSGHWIGFSISAAASALLASVMVARVMEQGDR